MLGLEGDIVKIQESFDLAPSNLPEKYRKALETVSECLGGVYNDMVIAYNASKNTPEEDDLKKRFFLTTSLLPTALLIQLFRA